MKKILTHIILILLLLAIPIVSSPDFDGTLSLFKIQPFIREFTRFVLCIIFFYLNLIIFLPKFFGKKKYFFFIVIVLLCYSAIIFIPYEAGKAFGSMDPIPQNPFQQMDRMGTLPPKIQFENQPIPPPDFQKPLLQNENQRMSDETLIKKIVMSLVPSLFSFLSSMFIYRMNEQRETEKAKAKAELLNLKYQLQPHFLFNILNSIYSLTIIKSDDAPEGILKLSNVMRYVVHESGEDWVELDKEIQYLKDYISLQLIRTDNSLDFSYTEIGEPKNLIIAPLILVNFVENAFKYGFNAEEKSKISIHLIIEDEKLNFKVFNRIVNKAVKNESLGVGQKNTLERLQQIYPGDLHQIKIENYGTTFLVDLKLHLTSHFSSLTSNFIHE